MTESVSLVLKIAAAAMVLGAGAWIATRIAARRDQRKVIKVCRKCSALNPQDLEGFAEEGGYIVKYGCIGRCGADGKGLGAYFGRFEKELICSDSQQGFFDQIGKKS